MKYFSICNAGIVCICWATDLDAVNISGDFIRIEFSVALHHLKPGKAPGPHSIFPELLIHAGPSLKFWLRGFRFSCLRQLKIPKVWRRARSLDLKTCGGPTELPPHLSALRPLQDPRTTDLQSHRTDSRPLAPKRTCWISTREVYHRSGRFAHAKN